LDNQGSNEQPAKIKDYLQEELEKICLLEAKTNHNLITSDEAYEIYQQIQQELLPQYDTNQLDDYLKMLEIEEKLFEDSINNINNNFSSIICPICFKSNLVQQNLMISCENGCDFKLDTVKTGIDMNQLKFRLDKAMGLHENCSEIPQFQFKNAQSMDKNELVVLSQLSTLPSASCFLIMSCDKCQFMEMVI
jgi:hypothetical protein